MPIDRRWEPPTLRETRRSYTWLWVLAVIAVLSLVVYFAFTFKPSAVPVSVQTQETVSSPKLNYTEVKPVFKSEAPSFDSHCSVVAGIITGSITNLDNTITFTFKNNGKATIEGSYFEASNENVKAYRKNMESLAPGEEATYSIDLNDVSNEVGIKVNSFIVLPVQDSKACINQRMIVIQ